MASLITIDEAKAWLEPTKLQHPTDLDAALVTHAQNEVLGRIGAVYDVSTWVDTATTPALVQTVISKYYAAWYYSRAYSEDNALKESPWVTRLLQNAEMLITGIIAGSIVIPPVTTSDTLTPLFYPNDASSALDPRDNSLDDTSVGPSKFSMGQVF